jgi:hypothetical protein
MRGSAANEINVASRQQTAAERAQHRQWANEHLRQVALERAVQALPNFVQGTRVTDIAKAFYQFLKGERVKRIKRRKVRRPKKVAKK